MQTDWSCKGKLMALGPESPRAGLTRVNTQVSSGTHPSPFPGSVSLSFDFILRCPPPPSQVAESPQQSPPSIPGPPPSTSHTLSRTYSDWPCLDPVSLPKPITVAKGRNQSGWESGQDTLSPPGAVLWDSVSWGKP